MQPIFCSVIWSMTAKPSFFFELENFGLNLIEEEMREGEEGKKYISFSSTWAWGGGELVFKLFGLLCSRQSGIYALSKTMTPNYQNIVYHVLFNSLLLCFGPSWGRYICTHAVKNSASVISKISYCISKGAVKKLGESWSELKKGVASCARKFRLKCLCDVFRNRRERNEAGFFNVNMRWMDENNIQRGKRRNTDLIMDEIPNCEPVAIAALSSSSCTCKSYCFPIYADKDAYAHRAWETILSSRRTKYNYNYTYLPGNRA